MHIPLFAFVYVSDVLDSRILKFIHAKYGQYSDIKESPSWAQKILPQHEKALLGNKVTLIDNNNNHLPVVGLPHHNHTLSKQYLTSILPEWLLKAECVCPYLSQHATFLPVSFISSLADNLTKARSSFGSAMPLDQVQAILQNIPTEAPEPPSCILTSPIANDILLKNEELAVPTSSGWRFQAGETYKATKATWMAISPNNHIVETQLTTGWKAPTFCQLKPAWFASLPFSKEEQAAWDLEVISLWQMRAIKVVDKQWVKDWGLPIVVMPIFLVKEPTKYRPILDARYSNLSFNPKWFALPSIMDFVTLLQKDLFWFKTDQKAGWQHLSLHPLHACLFGFVWQGKLFVYTSPPFGDATAPWIFTYMSGTLKRLLRNRGIPNVCYIDDLLFPATSDLASSMKLREKVLSLEKSLGFVMGAPKCPPPSQEGEALGFFVSTTQGIITISKKRINKVLTLLEECQEGKPIAAKSIAKLVGLVVSCSILHPQTLWFVAPLYPILSTIKTPTQWKQLMYIPKVAIKRVYSWLNHVRAFPRKLWVTPPSIRWVSSDATLQQVGAAIWDSPPNYLVSNTNEKSPLCKASSRTVCVQPFCIAQKETAAIPWALDLFWDLFAKGSTIHWAVDNTVALCVMSKGYSPIPYLQELVDQFMEQASKKNLVVLFHYVPSKLNSTSDWLTRYIDHSNDWSFNIFYWNKFITHCSSYQFPIPTVDCFAAAHNKRCDQYHSRFMDTGSRGDFFTSSLSQKEIHWANPPFSRKAGIIPKAFAHFAQQKVVVWFLLPVWTNTPWWTWTSRAVHSFLVTPRDNVPIFIPVVKTENYQTKPAWPIRIFLFDFRSQR